MEKLTILADSYVYDLKSSLYASNGFDFNSDSLIELNDCVCVCSKPSINMSEYLSAMQVLSWYTA